MGMKSRRKGKAFELVVRDRIRDSVIDLVPGLSIHRSSQAERAYEADLVIDGVGVPDWLRALWVECEHANFPDPEKKHVQALRDSGISIQRTGNWRAPVVCWRQTGGRTLWLSASLSIMSWLATGQSVTNVESNLLVTVKLDDMLAVVRARTADQARLKAVG